MKKIATIMLLLLITKVNYAQDFKKFRFGLKAAPSVSWLKPDTKEFKQEKAGLKFSYGLMTEFALAENYSFVTGLEVTTVGGGLTFPDSSYYMSDPADSLSVYFLNTRTYDLKYVDLPILLKMKTNEIGYMTYFGQFGFNLSFRTKARADDTGTLKGSSNVEFSDIEIEKDINLLRVALNLGLGAEYNVTGNTSIIFGLSYSNGFTNALKKNSTTIKNKTGAPLAQKAVSNYVSLNVGVLF